MDSSGLLFQAVREGKAAEVQRLLSEGASPRIVDRAGNTPFILAARMGHVDVVYTFFSADRSLIDEVNQDGYTVLSVATQFGHLDTVNMLLKYGAGQRELALLKAARYGKVDVLNSLIYFGKLNLHTCDANRNTPLMLAAQYGHYEVVAMLLSLNPEVDQVNEAGNTALMLAAREGHTDICQLLVTNARANTQVVNLAGQNALQLAKTQGNSTVHIETLSTLAPETPEAEEELEFLLEFMAKMNLAMNHADKENIPTAPVALAFNNLKKREATDAPEFAAHPINQPNQQNTAKIKKVRLSKSCVGKRQAHKADPSIKSKVARVSKQKVKALEKNKTSSNDVLGLGAVKKHRRG